MTGKELKKRLKMTGKTLVEISQLLGMSSQALNQILNAQDVKSLTIATVPRCTCSTFPMAAAHTDASLHALTPTLNPSFPTSQPIGHAIVGRPSLRASISKTTQSPWPWGMQVPIAQRAFISSVTCGRSMRPTVWSLITYYMAGSSYLLEISPVWRYFPVLV